MSDQLPHRFREKSCRRYEAIIAKFLERYPHPTAILSQSMGLSICTISNRLRDAIKSWQTNKWATEKFDLDKLLAKTDEIIVAEQKDGVLISFRSTELEVVEAPKGDSTYRMPIVSTEKFYALESDLPVIGKLASAGLLARPVYVRVAKYVIESLEAAHDVSATQEPDGSWRII